MTARMVVLCGVLVLAGCSSARVRVGPIGSGIATTAAGPGLEGAVSDASGTPWIAGRVSINLPAILAGGWGFLRGVLPELALAVGSSAATPTGPGAPSISLTGQEES